MFSRYRDEPTAPEVGETAPAPRAPQRSKVEMRDSQAFQPSTFASRKAASSGTRSAPRVVSLGQSELVMSTNTRGDTEVIDVELFADLDHPSKRFVRFPGQTGLTPLFDDERRDSVTRLAPTRDGHVGFRRPKVSAFPDPLPDQPPRPI